LDLGSISVVVVVYVYHLNFFTLNYPFNDRVVHKMVKAASPLRASEEVQPTRDEANVQESNPEKDLKDALEKVLSEKETTKPKEAQDAVPATGSDIVGDHCEQRYDQPLREEAEQKYDEEEHQNDVDKEFARQAGAFEALEVTDEQKLDEPQASAKVKLNLTNPIS
jgi:hypothetical protein